MVVCLPSQPSDRQRTSKQARHDLHQSFYSASAQTIKAIVDGKRGMDQTGLCCVRIDIDWMVDSFILRGQRVNSHESHSHSHSHLYILTQIPLVFIVLHH